MFFRVKHEERDSLTMNRPKTHQKVENLSRRIISASLMCPRDVRGCSSANMASPPSSSDPAKRYYLECDSSRMIRSGRKVTEICCRQYERIYSNVMMREVDIKNNFIENIVPNATYSRRASIFLSCGRGLLASYSIWTVRRYSS